MVDTVGRASPALAATSPAVIGSPPSSAASTAARVAPGAVRRGEPLAGLAVRRAGCCAVGEEATGLGWVVRSGLAGGWLARRRLRARVERGERLAKPVGLAEELVEAFLELFTQAVDHVCLLVVVGERAIVHAHRHVRLGALTQAHSPGR